MLQFLNQYGLFLAQTVTLAITILVVFAGIIAIANHGKMRLYNKIKVKKLNKKYQDMQDAVNTAVLTKPEQKKHIKQRKLQAKRRKKLAKTSSYKRIFVINFHGDINASATHALREEITAILMVANLNDEVVVRLESAGGLVHSYGLAASQLQRIKDYNIPLKICVDKVAASGGYMMACVADHILAAPFAIIGSIGVIGQLPNFHKLLKKHNIDYEQATAGEYKRTLTVFGENTSKGRKKFQDDIEEIHRLFKDFVAANRPVVNIEKIATGEHWHGSRALELQLVDKLQTSDDYLLEASDNADIYEITYRGKKTLTQKLSTAVKSGIEQGIRALNQPDQQIFS